MGIALSSVVHGPRLVDLLHLFLIGFVRHPILHGYLHHHRYAQIFTTHRSPFTHLTARLDSKGRTLDPSILDQEAAATEMYDIPITLVNRALYDRDR